MCNYPLLTPKQTFARIDYLRQGERLVDRKGTRNVKILAQKVTKNRFFRLMDRYILLGIYKKLVLCIFVVTKLQEHEYQHNAKRLRRLPTRLSESALRR